MVARFQSVSLKIKNTIAGKEGTENLIMSLPALVAGNAAGTYYHFLDDEDVKIIAVEAAGLGVDSGESAATSVLGK
jgi:tryptophan synthase beta chain